MDCLLVEWVVVVVVVVVLVFVCHDVLHHRAKAVAPYLFCTEKQKKTKRRLAIMVY